MSHVPPPFTGAEGARPKNNTGLIIMIVLAVLVGGCILAVGMTAFFGLKAWDQVKPIVGCSVAFESVHESLKDYARDHDGKLPPAATWQDELRPYVKASISKLQKEAEGMGDMFKTMDPDGAWGCKTGKGDEMTGMAFNTELSGKKVDDIESKSTTVIVFEIERPSPNANEPYKARDPNASPSIFGERRGWFEVTWEEADIVNNGQRTRIRSTTGNRGVRVDVQSGSEDPPAGESSSN